MQDLVLAARSPEREDYLGHTFNTLAFCKILEGAKDITVSQLGKFVPAKVEKHKLGIALLTIEGDSYALFAPVVEPENA